MRGKKMKTTGKTGPEMTKMHEQWLKERDAAVQSFDVETFKKFYKKWTEKGYYENNNLPSDEVIEISMRKMTCALLHPDPEKLEQAKAWLKEKGYSEDIY